MKNASPEFDAYIAQSAPFARPILKKIRSLFHKACPEVQEVMKWSAPHFEYKGLLGSMAAFKQHVSWGFWKAGLMNDPKGLLIGVGNTAMAAAKVTNVNDLPDDKTIIAYIHEAVRLNDEGVKVPRPKASERKELVVPDDLAVALKKNKKALATFNGFSYSHKKEYVEWIVGAKQEATRQRRLATAIEWLAEGKSRNWKYERHC